MHAAKAAAVTAASGRIDSLNNRLREGPVDVVGGVTDMGRKTSRRVADVAAGDGYDDEDADEAPEDKHGSTRPKTRASAPTKSAPVRRTRK